MPRSRQEVTCGHSIWFAGPGRSVEAAESWLRLVDEANYEAPWEQAAKLFKGAVTKEQWMQSARGVRQPLGKLVSPKVESREYAESIPAVQTASTW